MTKTGLTLDQLLDRAWDDDLTRDGWEELRCMLSFDRWRVLRLQLNDAGIDPYRHPNEGVAPTHVPRSMSDGQRQQVELLGQKKDLQAALGGDGTRGWHYGPFYDEYWKHWPRS